MARFGRIELDWFVFFRAPVREEPDPTRPSTTWAGAWCSILKAAALGPLRFHDTRHQFVTELAESGNVSPETIMQIAGHGSRKMIERYSHIRLSAKRAATDLLRSTAPETDSTDCTAVRRESEGRDTSRAQSRAQLERPAESRAPSHAANKGDSHFHMTN
jgi:Phage integrase family